MSSEYTTLIILVGLAVFVGSEESQPWVPIKLKTYLRLLVDGVPMVMEYPSKIECFIEDNKALNEHRNKKCVVSTDKSSYPLIEEALMTATEKSPLENDLTHTKESTRKVTTPINRVDKYETNKPATTTDKPEQTVSESSVSEKEVYTTDSEEEVYNNELEKEVYTTELEKDLYTTELQKEVYTTESEKEVYTSELEKEAYITESNKEVYTTESEKEVYTNESEKEVYTTESEKEVYTNESEKEVYTTENLQENAVNKSIILPISDNTPRICKLTENLCVTKYVIKNSTGRSIEEIELFQCPDRSMETCQLDAVYKKYQSSVLHAKPMSIELTVSKCDCPNDRSKRSITKTSWDTIIRNQMETTKVTLMLIWILLITFVLLVLGVCLYSWTTRRNILCFNLNETCKSFFKKKMDHTFENISIVDASIFRAKMSDSMA